MAEEAIMQRLRYAKSRTLDNLLNVYKLVIPVPKPILYPYHFYCPKSNIFIRVEVNGLPDNVKNDLIEFKNNCSRDTIIQVHVFKKNAQKPEIEEIG